MVKRLGWLADQVGIYGGAELSGDMLVESRPDDIEVVFCPADRRPTSDFDAFMLQNTVSYSRRWIEILEGKTLLKHFRDPWHPGDIIFRRWVLDNVDAVIYNSPLGKEHTPWSHSATHEFIVPPPVDIETFKRAGEYYEGRGERSGNVFVGRVDIAKGAHRAIDWALDNNEPLDLYGAQHYTFGALPDNIRYHGPQPYTKMPQIYGQAERFVFLPGASESYSRTTVEAWAAGCELVIDESKIGAMWWMEHDPDAMHTDAACEMFWSAVEDVI